MYKTFDQLTPEELVSRQNWYIDFNRRASDEFDLWVEDDATHWTSDEDAAFQAWTQVCDAKVFPLMLELEAVKQERDELSASVERLRVCASDLLGQPFSPRAEDRVLIQMWHALNETPGQSIRQAQEGE